MAHHLIDPKKPAGRRGNALTGHIDAVEITRLLSPRVSRKVDQDPLPSELSFAAKPVFRHSKAQRLRVAFMEEGAQLPQPAMDPESGRIDLFYSKSRYQEVRTLLTSHSTRLCYFWRSIDGSDRLAWLLTSPL